MGFSKQKKDSELRSCNPNLTFDLDQPYPLGIFKFVNLVWDLFDKKKNDYTDRIRRVDSVGYPQMWYF